ncbi:MAG TPA: hypothetical protein VEJ84_04360 [Acidimicrobiales bacterium]|nr:hypothetical protein [Acidimicrobiales bacterium]
MTTGLSTLSTALDPLGTLDHRALDDHALAGQQLGSGSRRRGDTVTVTP